MRPEDIETRSMEIIESELPHPLDEEARPIIKRVIHATADFSFADTMAFTEGAIGTLRGMLRRGCRVVTDTNMALAGINRQAAQKLGLNTMCLMADAGVAEEAARTGRTRAAVSMERALGMGGETLFVCGNAPTFLMALVQSGVKAGVGVIAVPVGFVNVVESKEQVLSSGIPAIVNRGRRGGSNVAAAIVNALMYGIEGVR